MKKTTSILKTLSLLILIISCGKKPESKIIKTKPNGLVKSLKFDKAKNQKGILTDYEFKIDTLTKLNFERIEFYKLNITGYDSIYLGKRNDTIFSYEQSIPCPYEFVILNENISSNLGRLGDDFGVRFLNLKDSIYNYSLIETTINDFRYNDVDYAGEIKHPEKMLTKISIDKTGKITNIEIRDKALKN
jgi:hypothetical protein